MTYVSRFNRSLYFVWVYEECFIGGGLKTGFDYAELFDALIAAWLIWKGWIWPTNASFMHSRNLAMIEIVSIAFATLLAHFKCSTSGTESVCVPLPESWTALTLLTVASFLVATFTNISISRWWSTRMHVNSISGKSKNIAMILACSTTHTGPEVAQQRLEVARLLNLAHCIALSMAQGPLTQEALDELIQHGLTTAGEARVLAGCPDAFVVIYGCFGRQILNGIVYVCYGEGWGWALGCASRS